MRRSVSADFWRIDAPIMSDFTKVRRRRAGEDGSNRPAADGRDCHSICLVARWCHEDRIVRTSFGLKMKLWPGQPDNWKPSAKDKGWVWVGLAICCFTLASNACFFPSTSLHSGRWGWLHQVLFNAFGASGDVILELLLGTIALSYGLISLRDKSQ